jgi:hypothetical protein
MARDLDHETRNKALVLEADALFNRRDFAAAEKYWSHTYIQHRDRPSVLIAEEQTFTS